VKDIEEKALDSFRATSRFKKPVTRVRMGGISFPMVDGELLMRTANELQVTLEGQKKVESVSMMHSYCPFCGEKYEAA
jgi:hypothetical protein